MKHSSWRNGILKNAERVALMGARADTSNRRQFLKQTAALAAALSASRLAFARQSQPGATAAPATPPAWPPPPGDEGKATRPLKLLVLGGTGLIGPFLVKRAVARGHHVTTRPATWPSRTAPARSRWSCPRLS